MSPGRHVAGFVRHPRPNSFQFLPISSDANCTRKNPEKVFPLHVITRLDAGNSRVGTVLAHASHACALQVHGRSTGPGTHETFLFNCSPRTRSSSRPTSSSCSRMAAARRHQVTSRRAKPSATDRLGSLVESRDAEDRALEEFFRDVREDASHLRVTLRRRCQCNFACDYCIQGDHHAHTSPEARMSARVGRAGRRLDGPRLDALGSPRFTLTFFGGESLLNLPVVYALAEQMSKACRQRGVAMTIRRDHQRACCSPRPSSIGCSPSA